MERRLTDDRNGNLKSTMRFCISYLQTNKPQNQCYDFIQFLLSLTYSAYKCFSKNNICSRIREQFKGRRYDMLTNITVFLSLYLILLFAYVVLAIVTRHRAAAIARRDRSGNRFEIATLRACAVTVVCHIVFHLPYLFYTLALHFGISDDHSYYTNAFVVSFFGGQ